MTTQHPDYAARHEALIQVRRAARWDWMSREDQSAKYAANSAHFYEYKRVWEALEMAKARGDFEEYN